MRLTYLTKAVYLFYFLLFAGNTGKPLAAAEAYDLETDAWTALPDMPAAHCSCAFTTFKEKLHVIGGLSLGGPTGAMEVLSSK